MSTEATHYSGDNDRTACGAWAGLVYSFSANWTEVTCGACKLEAPMQEVAGRVEYRTPDHVIETGKRLAEEGGSLADIKARHAERRLAEVRKAEESALTAVAYWAKAWQDAVSLRVSLERGAGVPTEGVRDSEAAEERSAGSCTCDDSSQLLWPHAQHAPVNAVDIRTEEGYAQGMKQKPELSSEAQSALIDVNSRSKAVSASGKVQEELRKAGILGPGGGLTSTGHNVRRTLMQDREDAAFG